MKKIDKYEQNYFVKFISQKERTDEIIQAFSNKFREVFSNKPYGQYIFDKKNRKPISAQDFFNTKDYVPLRLLDKANISEEYSFWHDPETTFCVLKEKLKKENSYWTILFNKKLKTVSGGTFCYMTNLKDAFDKYEEWNNHYLYSGEELNLNEAVFRDFLTKIKNILKDYVSFNLLKNNIMVWNCVFRTPKAKGFFHHMMKENSKNIPSFLMKNFVFLEILRNSKAYELMKEVNLFDTGFDLGEDHFIASQRIENFIKPFF